MASIKTWASKVATEFEDRNDLDTLFNAKADARRGSSSTCVFEPGFHHSAEELGTKLLRIEVGSGTEPGGTITFEIHETLLYTKIPAMREIVANTSQEIIDPDKVLPDAILPDDDPKAFKLLGGWIYTRRIDGDLGKLKGTNESPKGSFKGLFMAMKLPIFVKLCILAEKYKMRRLQDESINFLINFMNATQTRPNPSCWLEVYKHTLPKSKLRLLISRLAAWQLSQDDELNGVLGMDSVSILSRNDDLRADILALQDGNPRSQFTDPLLAPRYNYHSDQLPESWSRSRC